MFRFALVAGVPTECRAILIFTQNILLILSFRRVLYVICFLLGNSPASEF